MYCVGSYILKKLEHYWTMPYLGKQIQWQYSALTEITGSV